MGKNKAKNFSITWRSLSPLRISTILYPSSFNKCFEIKVLLATNVMANAIAPSVQNTSFFTKDLTCSNTYIEWPSTIEWPCKPNCYLTRMYYVVHKHDNLSQKGVVLQVLQKGGPNAKWSPWSSWTMLPLQIVSLLHLLKRKKSHASF